MSKNVVLTYRNLMFNNQFWQKLIHTPGGTKQHNYWLGKLFKKVESAQKELGRQMPTFIKDLGEKFGLKDPTGKVVIGQNGLPQPDPTLRTEYDDMFDEFASQELTLDAQTLPLEYFAHLNDTPLDWDVLGRIASFTETELQGKVKEQTHLTSIA